MEHVAEESGDVRPGGVERGRVLPALLFSLAYFGCAWVGDWLTFRPSLFCTFWPNSGLFLAVLLLSPVRMWPAFVMAAIPANIAFDLLHGRALWETALFTAGNCGEAVAGAWLVQRLCGGVFRLDSARNVSVLAVAALVATMVSATCGTLALSIAYDVEPVRQWLMWWSGDVLGVLIVAPCVCVAWQGVKERWQPRGSVVELGLLLVAGIGLSILMHRDLCGVQWKFLIIVPSLWAALRFGVREVTVVCLTSAIVGVAVGVLCPHPEPMPVAWLEHMNTQVVLGVASVLGLIVASAQLERGRAGEALRESRQCYEQLVEGTGDLATRVDSEGRFTFINSMSHRFYGLPPAECIGRLAFDFVHPDDREMTLRWFKQMVAGRTASASFENRPLARDGALCNMLWTCRFYYADDGRCLWVDSIARDITERKQAEEALREREDRYRSTLASMNDLVFVLDREDRFMDVYAPEMEKLLLPPAEILGKALHEVLPPAQAGALASACAALRDGGGVQRLEYGMEIQGKNTCWNANVSARRDAAGKYDGATVVARDVTEQKRLEEQLRQAEKMQAIGQLAGGVAHDFNNQLSGVMGFAELLTDNLSDPILKGYAVNIMKAASHSAELTRQLLAFSRKGKYLSAPTDIHRVIAEVIELLSRSIDKRIEIKRQLDAASATVMADPAQIQNALLNLGLNARDAMPKGGELVFATRVVTLVAGEIEEDVASGRYVQISVKDAGVGMDADMVKRLFEPFFTTKEVGKGTGLGLASVYGTVKNHGGAIRVASEPGRGSTFNVYLPLYVAQPSGKAVPAAGPVASVAGHGRILIVDDEAIILDLGTAMLRKRGYDVAVCSEAREALDFYRKEWRGVALVILDMIMPRMGARELFPAMREINPDIKALLSSGYSINGEAQGILAMGVLGFVQKPFRMADLTQKVAEALREE